MMMKTIGSVMVLLSIIAALYGFTMPVTAPGTNTLNQGLLFNQSNIVIFSGLMIIASVVLIGFGRQEELSRKAPLTESEREAESENRAFMQKQMRTWMIVLLAIGVLGVVFGFWS